MNISDWGRRWGVRNKEQILVGDSTDQYWTIKCQICETTVVIYLLWVLSLCFQHLHLTVGYPHRIYYFHIDRSLNAASLFLSWYLKFSSQLGQNIFIPHKILNAIKQMLWMMTWFVKQSVEVYFIMSHTVNIYGYVSLRDTIKDLYNLDLITCFTR